MQPSNHSCAVLSDLAASEGSRVVHPSRQREVPFYVDWYRQRGFKIVKVDLGSDYLEGNW